MKIALQLFVGAEVDPTLSEKDFGTRLESLTQLSLLSL